MTGHKEIWGYAHSSSVLFSVLLFLASFLCTLLWTNNIVPTVSSLAGAGTNTFTFYSPAVATFSLTYGVAVFGTVWNSVAYVTLLILERDTLPISTPRLRYDFEKAACTISVVGNALYSVACIALLSVLASLAAGQPAQAAAVAQSQMLTGKALERFQATVRDRMAGEGATAAFAGLAAVAAMWTCLMDALHVKHSPHRDSAKYDVQSGEGEALKPS